MGDCLWASKPTPHVGLTKHPNNSGWPSLRGYAQCIPAIAELTVDITWCRSSL